MPLQIKQLMGGSHMQQTEIRTSSQLGELLSGIVVLCNDEKYEQAFSELETIKNGISRCVFREDEIGEIDERILESWYHISIASETVVSRGVRLLHQYLDESNASADRQIEIVRTLVQILEQK